MKKDVIPEILEDERAMFPVDPRILAAAVEGARLATLAASRANATSRAATMPPLGASGAPAAANAEYREEAAFASVHDLVHYAIISCPAQRASLRQVYHICETQGRIALRHGGGSRHLTANEHWKSQIRHALYTSPRFTRVEEGEDDWRVSNRDAPAPATTTVRVYPADEPKAGPARPRGRPRKRKPGSEAPAARLGPERFIEEGIARRFGVSEKKAPASVPVPPGPRPGPVSRPPPLDARVGPPLGLAASASAANLAKPVARVRVDDADAATGNENDDDAFESPSEEKEGSSSKEEVTSPRGTRRAAVSPPRRPFAAANENAPRSAAAAPANASPVGGNPPPLVSRGASPDGSAGRATGATFSAELPEKRAEKRVGKAPAQAEARATARRLAEPRPVLVMVGDTAVAPAARDRSVNRRKPASGRRAALPHGVVPTSPPKRVARRASNTLSRLWETETRR